VFLFLDHLHIAVGSLLLRIEPLPFTSRRGVAQQLLSLDLDTLVFGRGLLTAGRVAILRVFIKIKLFFTPAYFLSCQLIWGFCKSGANLNLLANLILIVH
jgi:hypothetical protein